MKKHIPSALALLAGLTITSMSYYVGRSSQPKVVQFVQPNFPTNRVTTQYSWTGVGFHLEAVWIPWQMMTDPRFRSHMTNNGAFNYFLVTNINYF